MRAAKLRFVQSTYRLLRDAGSAWLTDNAPSMGAALAFYTIFSLVPVLVIATTVAGLVFGQHAAQREILLQVRSVFGYTGVQAVQGLIQSHAGHSDIGWLAGTIGIVTLLIGASGAFVELQDGLNKIWKVERTRQNMLLVLIRQRFLSIGLVLGLGFLLIVSLVLSAGIHAVGSLVGRAFGARAVLVNVVGGLISYVVIALLLMMIYRYLPNTEVHWREVWFGGAFASLLFSAGKALIGLYLGTSTLASSYGAAGSLVILLMWIYYSAQIILLGAEITHVRWQARVAPPPEGVVALPAS